MSGRRRPPMRSMPSEAESTRRWLHDIRHHIAMANGFVGGVGYDDFKDDNLRLYAVVRGHEIFPLCQRRCSRISSCGRAVYNHANSLRIRARLSLPLTIIRKMFCNAIGNYLSNPDGHSISNQTTHSAKFYWDPVSCKAVFGRKRLKNCSLPQCNSTVLLRMSKAPIPKSEALRRDRWCWGIPLHASVNTRIGLSGVLDMTFCPHFLGPIPPGSAGL